nr:MAG TPA: hypothetical protein [Caudoviricetes sp.]
MEKITRNQSFIRKFLIISKPFGYWNPNKQENKISERW